MIGEYEGTEHVDTKEEGAGEKIDDATVNTKDLYDPLDVQESEDEEDSINDSTVANTSVKGFETVDVSDPSDNEDESSMNQAEFSLEKSPEISALGETLSFVDDDDELLGTALAELEEEEKEKQKEKDKGELKKKKKKKDKDDKKKKKKKKKKKGKDKDKEEKEDRKDKKKQKVVS